MKVAENVNQEKYIEFLQAHSKGHFMQSPEWAKVKSNWKNEIIVIEDESGNIKGSMSLLIRKIPVLKYTMMYSPRGPVCDSHDMETLGLLLSEAKKLAKKYKSYTLKLDPDIEVEDVQFEQIMKDLGFKVAPRSKNFEGIQPRFVFRLDIKGKTEDELLQYFHQKVRYNIKLSAKKGVEVKLGTRDDIDEFHRIMQETGARDKFVIRTADYFKKMYDCLAPEHLRLYLAHYDGKIVAGTLALLYGNKVWYLYGASSNEYRNVMPNYLLQWEMIKWSLESGCEIYDFRGVSGDLDESNPL
ncbi:MAG: peptidoglycan bridge formation glycyltransferase FemA/FemB family protein, partial [Bacillota bacterium]|nr:peptidoglycan bridge formation glycyltransferase FemA/FemB family protein [Bacillota bacterium]